MYFKHNKQMILYLIILSAHQINYFNNNQTKIPIFSNSQIIKTPFLALQIIIIIQTIILFLNNQQLQQM